MKNRGKEVSVGDKAYVIGLDTPFFDREGKGDLLPNRPSKKREKVENIMFVPIRRVNLLDTI